MFTHVETKGRLVDSGGQIHHASRRPSFAASRWWQAVLQADEVGSCIPLNKACFGSFERGSTGHSLLCFVLLLLGVVLSWWEPMTAKMAGSSSFLNKVWILVFPGCNISYYLPPPARGGCLESDGGLLRHAMWLKASFGGGWWFQS